MKIAAGYLMVGLLMTWGWSVQIQAACGRPMSFAGFVFGPALLPVLSPWILINDEKPACHKMSLAGDAGKATP